MSAQTLLDKLEGVKGRNGHWRARCPGHGSKSGTLAIREEQDGRVLLHCFAGCEPLQVLQAVGLDWHDVMPARLTEGHLKPIRQPWAKSAMQAMRRELTVALLVLGDIEHDRAVTRTDKARAGKAAGSLSKWLKTLEE